MDIFPTSKSADITEDDYVELPLGLCKGDPSKFVFGDIKHAFFLRRAVPWLRAGPVLIVEAGSQIFSYPRDWFASDSDQQRVAMAINPALQIRQRLGSGTEANRSIENSIHYQPKIQTRFFGHWPLASITGDPIKRNFWNRCLPICGRFGRASPPLRPPPALLAAHALAPPLALHRAPPCRRGTPTAPRGGHRATAWPAGYAHPLL